MSRDYPIVAPGGGIQLEMVVLNGGELHLVLGRSEEPGVAELIVAITKLADIASLHAACAPMRRAARKDLEAAIEALHLAGRATA